MVGLKWDLYSKLLFLQKEMRVMASAERWAVCIPFHKVPVLYRDSPFESEATASGVDALPKLPYALPSTQSKICLFINRCSSFPACLIQAWPLVYQIGAQTGDNVHCWKRLTDIDLNVGSGSDSSLFIDAKVTLQHVVNIKDEGYLHTVVHFSLSMDVCIGQVSY